MDGLINNPVIQFLAINLWGHLILGFAALFSLLVLGLIAGRSLVERRITTKYLRGDWKLARHTLAVLLATPFFWLNIWLLKRFKKIQIVVHAPIPREEIRLIFALNHAGRKVQEWGLPMVFFLLELKNLLNPITNFPKITADARNFKNRFLTLLGFDVLDIVWREPENKTKTGISMLEQARKFGFEEYGGRKIILAERGRTQSAILKGRFTKRKLPGGEELYLGRLYLGAAQLSLKTQTRIVPCWERIDGDDSYPKASHLMSIWGWLELLFNPRVHMYLDINHPAGPLKPQVDETVQQLNRRLQEAMFEIGEIQAKRLEGKK